MNRIFIVLLLLASSFPVFAAKQKPLIVVLDWFMNPNHAPLFVAEEKGFFKKKGVEVKIISPADATQGEKMVVANKADVAITYQPALVEHVANGLPLMHFATLIDSPLNCLVYLKNGKISSIKDLKGKKIGYSTPGVDEVMLSFMLKKVGMSINDVEFIIVGFNLTQALLTEKVDGFVGGMRNFEPIAISLAGKISGEFYPEDYGFPMYDELIFVTHKNKTGDPRLIKFAEALKEGVRYLKKNPVESWKSFSKKHPELDDELNKRVWFLTLPYFADDPFNFDGKRYGELAKFMKPKE